MSSTLKNVPYIVVVGVVRGVLVQVWGVDIEKMNFHVIFSKWTGSGFHILQSLCDHFYVATCVLYKLGIQYNVGFTITVEADMEITY